MDESTKAKIDFEISQIDELVSKSSVLISLVKVKEPDFIEISAIGSILHSFYNGIENIFQLYAKSQNYNFKQSNQSHRDLIDFVFNSNQDFLSDKKSLLEEYMGFRHFFRHTYGYTIKWERCSHLFLGLADFWNTIKSEIEKLDETA